MTNPNPNERSVKFEMEANDGDSCTITISGYERGSTAIAAAMKVGHTSTIHDLATSFAHEGDMSVLTFFQDMAERFDVKLDQGEVEIADAE